MGNSTKELSVRTHRVEAGSSQPSFWPAFGKRGKAHPAIAGSAPSAERASWRPLLLGLLIPVTLVAGWEFMDRLSLVDRSLFSSPSQILTELSKLVVNGALLRHLESTFLRVVFGFAIGVLAAT